MVEKNKVRICRWGITVEIKGRFRTIHLKGQNLEDMKNILVMDGRISVEIISQVLTILKYAKECNANLLEVRSYAKEEVLRFSFEFKFREDFLKFGNELKELSL